MPWTVEVCPEQLPLQVPLVLGKDFDASCADTIVFVLQTIVGASDIPVHHTLLSRSFLTKTRSWLKPPDFQSLRSPSSMVMRVAILQQSSCSCATRPWSNDNLS